MAAQKTKDKNEMLKKETIPDKKHRKSKPELNSILEELGDPEMGYDYDAEGYYIYRPDKTNNND